MQHQQYAYQQHQQAQQRSTSTGAMPVQYSGVQQQQQPYGSSQQQQAYEQQLLRQQQRQQQQLQQQQAGMAPTKKTSLPKTAGECFQAIYDYDAQDDDEVSFRDGDLIINCMKIDDGWMCGTVHRTGQYGMLPANYVTSVRL